MKAQEVLRRYAAGERDFRGVKLCGANFKGQDLSGADFSEADIRGAKFSDTLLCNTKFVEAVAGGSGIKKFGELLLVIAVSISAGVFLGFTSDLVRYVYFDSILDFGTDLMEVIEAFFFLLCGTILTFIFVRYGFSRYGMSRIVVITVIASPIIFEGQIADMIAMVLSIIFSGLVISATAVIGKKEILVSLLSQSVVIYIMATYRAVSFLVLPVIALTVSLYFCIQVSKEHLKVDVVRKIGLMTSSIGGTSFSGADLTNATFSKASLRNTNFVNSRKNDTCLTHVCWRDAQQLNRARVGNAILQDRKVRTLLTMPEKGYKQDLSNANLRGANLSGVTLEKANLTRAILSGALLKNAVLKDAILTEAQAVGADFTNACLTGATLEAWNIDSTTIFKNIDCEYVYLLEKPKNRDDRERRPHNINKVFQPGDFEKLFKEVQDDVQILIRNGVNPVALRSAFQKIREEYPDLPEDAFQGFQRRDKDVLVTVTVPPEIDKSEFEHHWDSGYQAGLKAGREESAALLASVEQRANSSEAIALALAQNPTPIQNTQNMTQNLTVSDRSQKIEVKGNVERSVIGQGDDNYLNNNSQIQDNSEPDA